ncbi:MAG: nucleotide pyrophosphohydrolase [Burkholderiales bacterium]|nr:nucleotide pyrophosphohydrolase [Burkholderiales bacterium]
MAQQEEVPGTAPIHADDPLALTRLRDRLRAFAAARDWEQFHAPKNLAIALSVEAAELLEHFQWVSEEGSRSMPADKRGEIADEIADVFLYLIRLADVLDVDLVHAAEKKIARNAQKYPVEKARGTARKYTEL